MINNQLKIIAVPGQYWEKQPLKEFVKETLVSERRILKKSNIDTERVRYSVFCKHIEDHIMKLKADEKSFKQLSLGPEYLGWIEQVLSDSIAFKSCEELIIQSRIGKSFIPPIFLQESYQALLKLIKKINVATPKVIQEKIVFLKEISASDKNYGLVEVIDSLIVSNGNHKEGEKPNETGASQFQTSSNKGSRIEEELINGTKFESDDISIRSNLSHVEITKKLHDYIYHPKDGHSKKLRIIYSDGSEADNFPSLSSRDMIVGDIHKLITDWPILRVSLISMRHLNLDELVNIAWFINLEVSKTRFYAETDKYCSEVTQKQLQEIEKPVQMQLYQTGLQPAVIGFFRGFLLWKEANQKNKTDLVITSYFYNKRKRKYEEGLLWF